VKNKNKNIAKFFSGKSPEPEISADDAWGKMNDMLNTQQPDVKGDKLSNAVSSHALKWLAGLTVIGLTVTGVLLFLNRSGVYDFAKNKNATENLSVTSEEKIENKVPANVRAKSDEAISKKAKTGEATVSDQISGNKKIAESGAASETSATADHTELSDREKLSDCEKSSDRRGFSESKEIAESRELSESKKSFGSKKPSESKTPYGGKDGPESISKSKEAVIDLSNAGEKRERLENLSGKRDAKQGSGQSRRSERTALAKSEDHVFNIKNSGNNKNTGVDESGTDSPKRKEATSLSLLKSLPFRSSAFNPDFSKKIGAKPASNKNVAKQVASKPEPNSLEVGLEWNLNSPFKQTNLLFNSIDSIRKPATLLIPGIWVTKSFRQKHFLTLSLSINQPYFGNNKMLAQATDTIPGVDSSHWYRNTNLIKTIGLNAALQYQYQFLNHLTIGAGIAYTRNSGALVQMQTFNRNDKLLAAEYVTLKGRTQTNPYLNADIFYFKAGLSYKIGRFQTGINILAPVRNVSASPQFPIRAINGQLYLRFRIW
jgi:hypothetical protein